MRESKQSKIDEHNYRYWLEKNTKGQRERKYRKNVCITGKRLSSKAMVQLALMEALGL